MLQCLLEEGVGFFLLRGPSPAHRRSGVRLAAHPCVACDAPSSALTLLPFTPIPKPPRTTIFSSARPENASSLMKALVHFGAGRTARHSGGVKRRGVPSTSARSSAPVGGTDSALF